MLSPVVIAGECCIEVVEVVMLKGRGRSVAPVLAQADRGGKSGLHRAECRCLISPGGSSQREFTESATETIPPLQT